MRSCTPPKSSDLAATLTDTFNRVNAANEPSAAPLENLGIHSGTSFTWNTDLAAGKSARTYPTILLLKRLTSSISYAGTAISFEVRDKADDIAQSAVVIIQ